MRCVGIRNDTFALLIFPLLSKKHLRQMASSLKNLSEYNPKTIPSASSMRFGIVVSEWNDDITSPMLIGAVDTLLVHGAKRENIFIAHVPGSFELVAGAKLLMKQHSPDSIICLGSVIRGDTPHFDYVCMGATNGIAALNANYDVPFIFGLLTTDNKEQALERCGGKYGNKGIECAITAIKMVALKQQ